MRRVYGHGIIHRRSALGFRGDPALGRVQAPSRFGDMGQQILAEPLDRVDPPQRAKNLTNTPTRRRERRLALPRPRGGSSLASRRVAPRQGTCSQ